jgi:excisionase family DNA binding protein
MLSPHYVTLRGAARILGVSTRTLARWARNGRVPGLKTPGGRWRFFAPDLALALEAVLPKGHPEDT